MVRLREARTGQRVGWPKRPAHQGRTEITALLEADGLPAVAAGGVRHSRGLISRHERPDDREQLANLIACRLLAQGFEKSGKVEGLLGIEVLQHLDVLGKHALDVFPSQNRDREQSLGFSRDGKLTRLDNW